MKRVLSGLVGLALVAWVLRWAVLEVAAHAAQRLAPHPLDEPARGPEAP